MTAFQVTPAPSHAPALPMLDRVAVVTGAAGLLGREHAAALRTAGAHVVLADLDVARCETLAAELPDGPGATVAGYADVTDADSLTALCDIVLEHFGHVDALINNAAIDDKVERPDDDDEPRDVFEYSLETWRRIMDVNVTGVFLAARVFGAPMVGAGYGSIVNVASTYGLVAPDPALYRRPDGQAAFFKSPAYPTSKAAVIGLTRYLAAQWGAYRVRVNALAPGGVANGQERYFVENYIRRTPLGRMARADDYREAVVFLASDASRYMTGQTLVVDGGFTTW